MATLTTKARVEAGLAYLDNADNTYLALGRRSAWANESAPPAEDPDADMLQEVIGYKKVSKVSLCQEIETGTVTAYPTITYSGRTYALIPREKAFQERPTLIYFEAEVSGSELPLGTYRQVGLHQHLQVKDGVTKTAVIPSEVASTGTLLLYVNKAFQNRTEDVKITERFILTVGATKEIR